jgi:subtilisin family serine protease
VEFFDLVGLPAVMERSRGSAAVTIAMLDGPVAVEHPDLAHARIRTLGDNAACTRASSYACTHGTFVAGVLIARPGSSAPAIAPECTLLVCPIFGESEMTLGSTSGVPSATPGELAAALQASVDAGARVINISASLLYRPVGEERNLERALDAAANRGALVIAAAGNQSQLASSPLTRHPWVIPVAACSADGRVSELSNLGRSVGRGLLAPGERVVSLGSDGRPRMFSGTSAAAPFVTGAAALLCSLFPRAAGGMIRRALCGDGVRRRIVPPLLDAWRSHHVLEAHHVQHRETEKNDEHDRSQKR